MVASTRRSARLASAPPKEAPLAKPAKAASKKAPPKKAAAAGTKGKPIVPLPAKADTKKKVATDSKKKTSPSKKSSTDKPTVTKKKGTSQKTVVTVEACKSWGAFKTRANKIAKAVGDRALVEINKEKPGRGNFVVTIKGVDGPIVSLLGMKRPFPALKALDMDEINGKILEALE